MELLLQYLNSIFPMTPELIEHLKKILKSKELRKRDVLLKAGHICENVYFMEKGLVRCYKLENGMEVSRWFMWNGDVIFAEKSFYTQTPSEESIQILEDSVLYYISYKELRHIYKTYVEFNYHRAELTEKYYLLSIERNDILQMPKAKDRYNYLLEKHPELFRRVPVIYIASFMRVGSATMTRLRNKIKANK